MSHDFDLFVMGGGSGGLAAAKRAAQHGATVALAEPTALGGTCVNRGCIPKKLMIYAADFAELAEDAVAYGWSRCQPQFDWQAFLTARNQYLEQLRDRQAKSLRQAGVKLIPERACFVDEQTVQVGTQRFTAKSVLIAVGGQPIKPNISGSEYAITSDEMFDLHQLPNRIAIIGGGYIGVEFASALRRFGTEVTILNDNECILTGFDDDVRHALQAGLSDRGITIHCNTTADTIERLSTGFRVALKGDVSDQLEVDQVLIATGRAPKLEHLGLEAAGVNYDRKAIPVDDNSRTNQAHIFAVGDCTNRLQLTPVARSEGMAVADFLFGKSSPAIAYDMVPSAVCARPEAASVGLTEAQARQQFGDRVQCFRKEFQPLFASLTPRPEHALVKLVVAPATDRILGVHMVGSHAAEIISSVAVAVQAGITKADLVRAIGIHPSSAEELLDFE